MASTLKKRRNANAPLLYSGLTLYGGLLALFGWQTWMFVNWIFPDDQLLAKVLTLISFDVMALFWSLVHTFYSFKSWGALWWVKIAWGLTFALSFVASILYLVIQFYFRFHLAVDPTWVSIGNAVSIIALVSNVLALMAWLILEYAARHPHQHEFDDDEEEVEEKTQRPSRLAPSQLPSPQDDPEVARLRRLAEFAQQKGYSLESLESLLGVPPGRDTSPLPVTPNLNGVTNKKSKA